MLKSKLGIKLFLIIGAIALLNYLGYHHHTRADLTKTGRFTLSEGTKRIVQNLEDVVTIKAYVSDDLATDIENFKRELFNILGEYEELSDGNIEVIRISPDLENEEEVKEAEEAGIRAQQSQEQKKGELSAKIFFFGLTIEYGEEKEVIPFLQPGSSLEYPISRAIKKLTFVDKPRLGIITGNAEPNLQEYRYMMEELRVNFDPVGLNPEGGSVKISECDALMILSPSDTLSDESIQAIENLHQEGKSIFLSYNNTTADVFAGNGMAGDRQMPIENWLETKGVQIDENIVHDLACFDQNPIFPGGEFYYFPIAQRFANHPISENLGEVGLLLTSTISFNGSEGSFKPLLFTSERSGTDDMPTALQPNKQWTDADFAQDKLTIGGLYSGPGGGKIFVMSAGNCFQLNQQVQQMQLIKLGNLNLIINAFDQMSGINDLTEARNKRVTMSKLDKLEEDDIAMYRYINFLLPVLLVIGYGVWRNSRRKARRQKWKDMELA